MFHLPSWEKLFQNEYNALYTHNFNYWISNYINLAPDDTLFVSGMCADMIWRGKKYTGPTIWEIDYYELEFDTKPEDYLSNDKFKPFIDEIETFKTMSKLLKNDKYGLKGLYVDEFPKLFLTTYQVNKLSETYLPKLYEYLTKINLDSLSWLSSWVLTLFTKHFEKILPHLRE